MGWQGIPFLAIIELDRCGTLGRANIIKIANINHINLCN